MKPKFLLHSCCAPCSIAVIDELSKIFDVIVFFYNPNIYPQAEYMKRKEHVIKVCQEWKITFVDMDYDAQIWHEKVAKGLELADEGGARCFLCFKFRLAKAAAYARKNSIKHWGTSLSMGRNKSAKIISSIAKAIGDHYGLKFYDVDWKTNGRQERAARMTEERSIYRQSYCGCVYSLKNSKPTKV